MRFQGFFITVCTLAVLSTAAIAQDPARVRVAHLSPDAPPVDILVDGGLAFANVAYPGTTAYAELAAGTYNIQVVPAGETEPAVIDIDLTLAAGIDYTAAAVNVFAAIEPILLVDDNNLDPNRGRLRVVHASPTAPAVDIAIKDGPILYRGLEFKDAGVYRQGPSGTYDLEVRLAGTSQVVLDVPGVTITANKVVSVFAIGLVEGDPPLSVLAVLDARCSSDLDDNGIVDINDVILYSELFRNNDPVIDFNGDGVINREDTLSFLEKWQTSDIICDC